MFNYFVKKLSFLLLLAILLLPTLIQAQTENQTENNGNDSFFLRLLVGAGDGSFVNEPIASGSELEYKGTPFIFSLQLGGSIVIPDLSLHGGISTIVENDANVNSDELIIEPQNFTGESKPFTTHQGGYQLYMLTIGLSYRIRPYNFYISADYRLAGRAEINIETDRTLNTPGVFLEDKYTYKSGRGFGFTATKEWLFSPDWGLGVALLYSQDTFDGDDFGDVDVGTNLPLPPAKGISRFIGVAISTTYSW